MENTTFKLIRETLEKSQEIGILTPSDPSLDKMAGALALYLVLKETGKVVTVATPKDPLVEVSSLVGIDKVTTSLGSAKGDLIVSFPYKEGEIEKVSYTLDNDLLNIVVKAGEAGLAFEEKDVKFTRGGGAPDLLFTIGAARVSDLGHLFDPEALKNTKIINIDNEAENQGYGDIVMVSNKFSSVSEAVANLILSLGLKLDVDSAQNLLDGILSQTKNFQSPKTSSLAFEMAGVLMRIGAERRSRDEIEVPKDTARLEDLIDQAERRAQLRQANVKEEQQENKPQEPKLNQAKSDDNPPDDWLTPKIYKGSTDFE